MILDPSLPPVDVVLSVAPPNQQEQAVQTIRILAWDIFAKRWTDVFDSATTTVFNPTFPLDAPDTSYDQLPTAPSTGASEPSDLSALVDTRISSIADQPGGGVDLVFSGIDGNSATGVQLVRIVHFADGVASVPWAYEARDLGNFTIAGSAPHQQLAFDDASWVTPADAECCGVRTFRFVVARTGGDGGSEFYSVVSDNRSWLGAWVLATANPPSSVQVLSVTPDSPAAGLLQPGDLITGVEGTSPRSVGLIGSPVVDEIAEHQAGTSVTLDILRAGKSIQVKVVLGSRSEKAAVDANAPDPGYLDAYGETMTQQLAQEYSLPYVPGFLVTKVPSGGPAADAGLSPGDTIDDIGDYAVTSADSLNVPLVQIGAYNSTTLQFVSEQGVQHTVNITLGSPPATSGVEYLPFL
jgi:hypothetical protein